MKRKRENSRWTSQRKPKAASFADSNPMKTTITLKNNFHNTSTRLRVTDLTLATDLDTETDFVCTITKSQYERAKRKLCGMKDCTCGSVRGPQVHPGIRNLIVLWKHPQYGLVGI